MRRYSRREQALIGLCAVVVLVVGLPALGQMLAGRGLSPTQARARLRAARQQRAAHAAVLARLEETVDRTTARRSTGGAPRQAWSSSRVLSQLDERARGCGVALREVRPLPDRLLDGATGLPLQFSFAASFPQAGRFLAGLRANPEGLAVERVVIASASPDTDQVTVQVRVLAFSMTPTGREGTRG